MSPVRQSKSPVHRVAVTRMVLMTMGSGFQEEILWQWHSAHNKSTRNEEHTNSILPSIVVLYVQHIGLVLALSVHVDQSNFGATKERSRVTQFAGVQIKNQTATTVFSKEHCVVKAHYRGRQMVLFSDSFPPFSQY